MKMKFSDFGLRATCLTCGGSGKAIDHADIGRWVKGYRERCGWTLKDVSTKTALSIGYISDLEHGRRNWNAVIFERIVGEIKS